MPLIIAKLLSGDSLQETTDNIAAYKAGAGAELADSQRAVASDQFREGDGDIRTAVCLFHGGSATPVTKTADLQHITVNARGRLVDCQEAIDEALANVVRQTVDDIDTTVAGTITTASGIFEAEDVGRLFQIGEEKREIATFVDENNVTYSGEAFASDTGLTGSLLGCESVQSADMTMLKSRTGTHRLHMTISCEGQMPADVGQGQSDLTQVLLDVEQLETDLEQVETSVGVDETIYIDAASGDDDNDARPGTPIKTLAEFSTRAIALQTAGSVAVKALLYPGTYDALVLEDTNLTNIVVEGIDGPHVTTIAALTSTADNENMRFLSLKGVTVSGASNATCDVGSSLFGDGALEVRDCIFSNTMTFGTARLVKIRDCEFQGNVTVNNCKLDVLGAHLEERLIFDLNTAGNMPQNYGSAGQTSWIKRATLRGGIAATVNEVHNFRLYESLLHYAGWATTPSSFGENTQTFFEDDCLIDSVQAGAHTMNGTITMPVSRHKLWSSKFTFGGSSVIEPLDYANYTKGVIYIDKDNGHDNRADWYVPTELNPVKTIAKAQTIALTLISYNPGMPIEFHLSADDYSAESFTFEDTSWGKVSIHGQGGYNSEFTKIGNIVSGQDNENLTSLIMKDIRVTGTTQFECDVTTGNDMLDMCMIEKCTFDGAVTITAADNPTFSQCQFNAAVNLTNNTKATFAGCKTSSPITTESNNTDPKVDGGTGESSISLENCSVANIAASRPSGSETPDVFISGGYAQGEIVIGTGCSMTIKNGCYVQGTGSSAIQSGATVTIYSGDFIRDSFTIDPAATITDLSLLGALSIDVETDFYVDGDAGDDSADGLTWGTAKKTFQFLSADGLGSIPRVLNANVTVNARGTVLAADGADNALLVDSFSGPGTLYIKGETTDVQTDIVVTGYENTTSVVGHHSYITASAETWTTNEHQGRFLKITAGTGASNSLYPISRNSATQLESYYLPDLDGTSRVTIVSMTKLKGARVSDPSTLVAFTDNVFASVKNNNNDDVNVENLDFTDMAASQYPRIYKNETVTFYKVSFRITGYSLSIFQNTYIIFNSCYFNLTGYTYTYPKRTTSTEYGYCVFESNDSSGYGIYSEVGYTRTFKCRFSNQYVAYSALNDGGAIEADGEHFFDTCTYGIQCGGASTKLSAFRTATFDFKNCTNAIEVCSSTVAMGKNLTLQGTGVTNEILLSTVAGDKASFADANAERRIANPALGSGFIYIDPATYGYSLPSANSPVPTATSDPGVEGETVVDGSYIYRYSGGSWTRAPLTFAAW